MGTKLMDVRCPICQRLLFRVENPRRVAIEIKCPKCRCISRSRDMGTGRFEGDDPR